MTLPFDINRELAEDAAEEYNLLHRPLTHDEACQFVDGWLHFCSGWSLDDEHFDTLFELGYIAARGALDD